MPRARSLFAGSDFFGAAMGISESFLSLGWIFGPVLGGYAADLAGFAAPFLLTAALALACAPLLAWLMPAGARRLSVLLNIHASTCAASVPNRGWRCRWEPNTVQSARAAGAQLGGPRCVGGKQGCLKRGTI